MELILIFLFWLSRGTFLRLMSRSLLSQTKLLEDFLFYSSYSLDHHGQELMLQSWSYKVYQGGQSILFSSFLLGRLDLSRQVLGALFAMALLLWFSLHLSKVQQSKSQLITELSSFVFYYELFLMQGENQLQALRRATPYFSLLHYEESVEEYRLQFNQLFYFTKWLVVKRFMILLEKGMHFTQKDMSMEFAQIADELFQRHYQDKKLQAEKLENLMLLPMIGDLLIMVGYLMSPFLKEILGG